MFHDTDVVSWKIPEGYSLEAAPETVELDIGFAVYSNRITFDPEEGEVRLHRELKLKKSLIEPELYGVFTSFLSQVSRADNAQIVLVNTEGNN
jgi:hypothetical protein